MRVESKAMEEQWMEASMFVGSPGSASARILSGLEIQEADGKGGAEVKPRNWRRASWELDPTVVEIAGEAGA